jgi:hypothetical protein
MKIFGAVNIILSRRMSTKTAYARLIELPRRCSHFMQLTPEGDGDYIELHTMRLLPKQNLLLTS